MGVNIAPYKTKNNTHELKRYLQKINRTENIGGGGKAEVFNLYQFQAATARVFLSVYERKGSAPAWNRLYMKARRLVSSKTGMPAKPK